MTAVKRGLGRGLDALLDPYSADAVQSERTVLELDVREIDTNAQQPRKYFDEEALSELSESIRVHGVVQPLIVKKRRGRYMIVAGERRFRAARLAGLERVPAIVAEYDDAQLHEVSLIENIQRENLNPIEEAAAIRFLMEQHDMTQEEAAARLGKSRPAVANALRLLSLPESVLQMLRDGILSAGHGRALAGLADEAQKIRLADETVRLSYSVRALETRIKNLYETAQKPQKAAEKRLCPDLSAAEEKLRERLGTKVKLSGTAKRGVITIAYYSAEELQRLYAQLMDEA